ncbi:Arc family DNA-binding protein [Salmonella enterica]|nr:Arc family DNA-binding protein [Escherichia coli]EFP1214137.1 Arc family DNA-binding protein [Salmonella enterica]EJF5652067.1 Arc family DNA-binding protein [Salmonella enterica]EJF5921570.1 Arc family DNA-binding protein [Salmonella enterica]EJF5944222.1 Arc family DNA-binding protein [Salmonella enterica]
MSKRDDPQLRVRIPELLKEALEKKARANKRTLTSEIVSRLESTILQDKLLHTSRGFEEAADEILILRDLLEKLKTTYHREYQAEWVYENKHELIEAMEKLKKLLNPENE